VTYKRKITFLCGATNQKTCTPPRIYDTFTAERAVLRAKSDAAKKLPKTVSEGGCTWSTIPEVRNAKYETSAGCPAKLQPRARCWPENPTPGNGTHGVRQDAKQVIEYTPGGKKPPCANNVEGNCVQDGKDEAIWSKTGEATDWTLRDTGSNKSAYPIFLSYEYRWVADSITKSGTGQCPPPPGPGTWFVSDAAKVGEFMSEDWYRCEDRIRKYDCCCNCPEAVKALQIVGGLSPCPSYSMSNAQQKTLITAALLAGACVAAVALGAQFSAAAAGIALRYGCSTAYASITAYCVASEGKK